MAIDLYVLEGSPPCRAVMLVARHLGIELNIKQLHWMTQDHMKPEFIKINPQHCVPTIDDNGFYLWESRAIMTYFVNKYRPDSDLYPKEPKKRAIIDRLLYFDLGTLHKCLVEAMYPPIFYDKERSQDKETEMKKAIQILEDIVEKAPFVAGEHLSLADISILLTVNTIRIMTMFVDVDLSPFSNIEKWEERVISCLPFYREVTEASENTMKQYIERRSKLAKEKK